MAYDTCWGAIACFTADRGHKIKRNNGMALPCISQVHLAYTSPTALLVTWVTGNAQASEDPPPPPSPLRAAPLRPARTLVLAARTCFCSFTAETK